MTHRNQRKLLWTLNVVLVSAIAVSVWTLAARPAPLREPQPPESSAAPVKARERAAAEPLSAYAVISQRDLRKPLFDVETARADAPRPKLNLTLVGTAVEPGFTYAILRDGSGQTKLVSVGESVEGAQLTAVTDGQATLKFGGADVTLTVEKSGGKP